MGRTTAAALGALDSTVKVLISSHLLIQVDVPQDPQVKFNLVHILCAPIFSVIELVQMDCRWSICPSLRAPQDPTVLAPGCLRQWRAECTHRPGALVRGPSRSGSASVHRAFASDLAARSHCEGTGMMRIGQPSSRNDPTLQILQVSRLV